MVRHSLAVVLLLTGCLGSVEEGPARPRGAGACSSTAAVPTLSRLTRAEYDRSVEALTGATSTARTMLPPDDARDGLELGGPMSTLVADTLYVAAASVADAADLSRLVICDPMDAEACAEETARRLALRAYRRPPTDAEIDALMVLYREGSSDPALSVGFEEGVRWMLSGVLVAPQFLYHQWGPLGAARPGDPLHGYALAARLSFFLWGAPPDDALLAAAGDGLLDDRQGVALEARRMLEDPRARVGVRSFFRQWLHIDRVSGLSKDAVRFPGFDVAAAGDLEGSLVAFTDHAFWEGGYHELETSPNVWMNGRLAGLYGGDATGDALVPVALDPGHRAGLLGQPALLAMLATAEQGHPIRRGVFAREHLACQDLIPPPASVATPIPPVDAASTTRERFAAHSASARCNSCHRLIDGVGFALERFDAIGRARDTEAGQPIDDSGRVCSYPDCASSVEVHGQVELAAALADGGVARRCLTREWMRYSVHAAPEDVDPCELSRITSALEESDDLGELLVAIATSELMGNAPVEGGE